jgi:hypothetical protein
MTKNWKNFTADFDQKLQFPYPKGFHEGETLKREHPALQSMKFLYFFPFLCTSFDLLDPDPATQINLDPNPKPKPCCEDSFFIRKIVGTRV